MYSSDCSVERHDVACGLDGAHRQRLARRADAASRGQALVFPLVLGALGPRELQPVLRTYPGDGVLQRSSTWRHRSYHLPNTTRGQRAHSLITTVKILEISHILIWALYFFVLLFFTDDNSKINIENCIKC